MELMLSPCVMRPLPALLQGQTPAIQLVHGTYRDRTHRGFVVSGLPHSRVMSSFVWNFISPNSCHIAVSSYPAYIRTTRSKLNASESPMSARHSESSSRDALLSAVESNGMSPGGSPPYWKNRFGIRYGP